MKIKKVLIRNEEKFYNYFTEIFKDDDTGKFVKNDITLGYSFGQVEYPKMVELGCCEAPLSVNNHNYRLTYYKWMMKANSLKNIKEIINSFDSLINIDFDIPEIVMFILDESNNIYMILNENKKIRIIYFKDYVKKVYESELVLESDNVSIWYINEENKDVLDNLLNEAKEFLAHDDHIQLASILYSSMSNGAGLRDVIFTQGCSVHCKNCFNGHTWNFHDGESWKIDKIIENLNKNTINHKVTLSGGNPLEQQNILPLLKALKENGYNIWCYTGFLYEYCLDFFKDELQYIDVLVDGPFKEEFKSEECRYRGSSNQRIIDVQKSLKERKIIELNY